MLLYRKEKKCSCLIQTAKIYFSIQRPKKSFIWFEPQNLNTIHSILVQINLKLLVDNADLLHAKCLHEKLCYNLIV